MKKGILGFLRRGLISCGIGPVILAVIYLILQSSAGVETLTVRQVCIGIFSITVLAFLAGGLNVLYQIERLPLPMAILIHGVVLYVGYLITYLLNGWVTLGVTPILVFSLVFVVGYIAIWASVYCVIRRKTRDLNAVLREKQNHREAVQ